MLKPLSSSFNDHRSGKQWIKLKKDFIPGAGDTLDFVVVGASWQRDRGRTLNGKFLHLLYPDRSAHQTLYSPIINLHYLFHWPSGSGARCEH